MVQSMIERVAPKRAAFRRLYLLAIAISFTVPGALAQTNAAPSGSAAQSENPATKPPEYDVASIKVNKSDVGWRIEYGNDRFTAINVSLKQLLQTTYQIKEDLISGISGPIESGHFDIETKSLGSDPNVHVKLSDEQLRAMLIPVLAERFQLKVHTEVKELPIYELIAMKDGPKLKSSARDIKDGNMNIGWSDTTRSITAKSSTIENLASALATQIHRTVIDKTGLTEHYDFELKWTPDDGSATQANYGPGIFTAIQEQLGLKLQPAKGPVKTLIVDHAEMPSAN
jgi:uncharacterized protein (TIGR03435 family)